MKYLSLLLLIGSFMSSAQRIEFEDPDLTFSFVKPQDWIVKDGLTVFVTPNDESIEEPNTFFSITYFEEPIPTEANENVFDANEMEPSIPSGLIEFNPSKAGKKYIANEVAMWASYYHTQSGKRLKVISYVFMKLNQRFEISISAPLNSFDELESQFQSILESLLIEK
ncbi:MAG: hypothetical protein AB8B73_13600 [Ekhidna sp.]